VRRAIVAGNAKMNLDRHRLAELLHAVRDHVDRASPSCDVVYCPPATLIPAAAGVLAGSAVGYGAQNMHWEASGAFTGELSLLMLREWGCTHVILGHSERRSLFGETDAAVRRKAEAAMTGGLVPIVCVGETESERTAGATEVVLSRQVSGSLAGLPVTDPRALVVAYEPVWAIGTGKTATPEQAQEAHAHLRSELGKVFGEPLAGGIRVLYGGSVKPDNARELLTKPDVDGALVGGASLDARAFLPIIDAAP